MLDLFELDNRKEDIFPESWIGFQGDFIFIIKELIDEILKRDSKFSYYKICIEISNDIGLAINSVWRYLKQDYILIPILNSILILWKIKTNKTDYEVSLKRQEIVLKTNYLKVNNSSSKPVLAIKEINKELSYLLGSHAADGMLSLHVTFHCNNKKQTSDFKEKIIKNFSDLNFTKSYYDRSKGSYNFGISINEDKNSSFLKYVSENKLIKNRLIRVKHEYRWKLVDSYYNAINSLNLTIKRLFDINLNLKNKENYCQLEIKNKILARYLNKLFQFPFGKKSRIVSEPILIENSELEIRKEFFKGVLTFDGGISKDGEISLESYSPFLINNFKIILNELNINYFISKSKRGSNSILIKNYDHRILDLFDEKSEKYDKAYSFINGFEKTVDNEQSALKLINKLFLITGKTRINSYHCLESFKRLKIFSINDFINSINEIYGIKISNDIAITNLKLFEKTNIIFRTKIRKHDLKDKVLQGSYVISNKAEFKYNSNINEWKLP